MRAPKATNLSTIAGAPGLLTIRRGDTGPFVKQLQALIGVAADGYFGPQTEAAAREKQRGFGLVPDGIVGPKTWAALAQ